MTLEDRTWMLRGNCLNLHPDIMFPDEDNPDALTEAKLVCQHCPVFAQCASWARRHDESDGVWAGSMAGRYGRRKKGPQPRGRKPCGTNAAWKRHRADKEDPCKACEIAHKEYTYDYWVHAVSDRMKKKRDAQRTKKDEAA